MTFSPDTGSCVEEPSASKVPSAAIFVATCTSPPAHLARTVASISSRLLSQGAQRDDRVAGAEEVLRRRGERAAAEIAGRAFGGLRGGGGAAGEQDGDGTQNDRGPHAVSLIVERTAGRWRRLLQRYSDPVREGGTPHETSHGLRRPLGARERSARPRCSGR